MENPLSTFDREIRNNNINVLELLKISSQFCESILDYLDALVGINPLELKKESVDCVRTTTSNFMWLGAMCLPWNNHPRKIQLRTVTIRTRRCVDRSKARYTFDLTRWGGCHADPQILIDALSIVAWKCFQFIKFGLKTENEFGNLESVVNEFEEIICYLEKETEKKIGPTTQEELTKIKLKIMIEDRSPIDLRIDLSNEHIFGKQY